MITSKAEVKVWNLKEAVQGCWRRRHNLSDLTFQRLTFEN